MPLDSLPERKDANWFRVVSIYPDGERVVEYAGAVFENAEKIAATWRHFHSAREEVEVVIEQVAERRFP